MMNEHRPPFTADHVGSLIRPPELVKAHQDNLSGSLSIEALREIENGAITEVIAMQERVGLQAITDGEFRRNNWRDRFFENVDGFSEKRVPSNFTFTEFSGEQRTGMPVPVVVGKLRRRTSLTADDFKFVPAHTKLTAKATLPTPSANHFFAGDSALAGSPYKIGTATDREAFFRDMCSIYRRELQDLSAAGCSYVQLDEVPLAVLCDPENKERVRQRGEDPEELIDTYIKAIDDVVRDRPSGMVVCLHLCRGNSGHGQGAGGYEEIAERLFNTDVDGFFLEYDTPRAGDFSPLRHLPKSKVAVLGMISTKVRELEPVDDIVRRVHDAARVTSLEQLRLSPQCGFASSFRIDRFTSADQERKLAHLVKIADRIWN